MTPNETKLQNLRNYLDTLIGEYREAISSSVREMEKFNISPEDFRKESVSLNVAAFTLGYLNLAKEVSEKSDYKTTENYIRFHKHQIETKAIGEAGVITLAQNATISALNNPQNEMFAEGKTKRMFGKNETYLNLQSSGAVSRCLTGPYPAL